MLEDVAHLHPLTNVPTMYQLPLPYNFQDIAQTRFLNSRSLQQGQRSKSRLHHDFAYLHPQPMSLPTINILHLRVPEIQPGQTSSCRLPTNKHIRQPWVKTIPTQLLKAVGKNSIRDARTPQPREIFSTP